GRCGLGSGIGGRRLFARFVFREAGTRRILARPQPARRRSEFGGLCRGPLRPELHDRDRDAWSVRPARRPTSAGCADGGEAVRGTLLKTTLFPRNDESSANL